MTDVVPRPRGCFRVRMVGMMSGQRYPIPTDCPPFFDVDDAQDWCDEANKRVNRLTRWEPAEDAWPG